MNSAKKSNMALTKLGEVALDIFYPKKCIFCNSFINIGRSVSICRDCMPKLIHHGKVVRDNDKYFEEAVCALKYSDLVKSAMIDFKFNNLRYLYKTFAYAVYEKIKNREFLKDVSIICPVPIHPLRDRAYNQSELMAEYISQLTGIDNCGDLLIKIKNITPLSKMGYRMRKHHIKSAIAFNIQYNIVGKVICLIDDIYTTGATANECSRILRMHGAKKVYVVSSCYAEEKYQGGNENADTDITG